MKHVVILFDEKDISVAERLEKALALMQRNGILKTFSSLHIQPGMDVQATVHAYIEQSDVTIIVLSIDLNQDLIFDMIEKHQKEETDLFVVYANYVEDALIDEFRKHQIPITPIMPIAQHPNKDAAYRKISNAVRNFLKQPPSTAPPKTSKKRLLVLLAARRNMQNE